MATVIRCRDVGFDCEGIIRAKTEDGAVAQAAEHAQTAERAQTVRGLSEITPVVVAAVRAAMREE